MLAVLSIAVVFSVVACDSDNDGNDGKVGLLCATKHGVYTIYKYVDDGRTDKTLDLGVELGSATNVKIQANSFSGNESIEKLIVSSNVTAIEEGAFAGMKALKEIVLPFVGASANADATYGESGKVTDKAIDLERTFGYLFGTSEYDGGSLVTISYNGESTSERYMPTSLQKVEIKAANGYKIPMDAFNGCVNLAEIKLCSGITEIGEYAFNGCKNLASISVPETVTIIHKGAFKGCTSLGDVLENATALTSIGESAFEGAKLGEITLPANIVIGKKAFSGSTVKTVNVSGNEIMIGDSAFASCTKLTAVIFDNAGGKIKQFAFQGATKLTQFGSVAGQIKTDGFDVESLAFDPEE